MKILFIIARGDAFGGASLHVRDTARRLMNVGHEVKILVGGTPEMVVARRFAEKNLDFTCIPSMSRSIHLWKDTKALLRIRREIRAFSPDIVSTHASKAGALGRLASIGLGVVTIYTPHCWSFVDGFKNAKIYLFMERLLAKFTTQIVAVSEWERQFGLSRGVGKAANTICIHNGVMDESESEPKQPTSESGTVRLVMTARFEEQKDHPLLLRSLEKLKHLDWHLTFVGDGPLEDDIRDLASQLQIADRIEFAGYSSQVETFLNKSDAFLLVTHWEGFPRSTLEAMRAGLPVLVSDVGGCAEAVEEGANGFVVKKGDIEGLTKALKSLITDTDLRHRMARRSRERYLEEYTFETMYQNYRRLYSRLSSPKDTSLISAKPSPDNSL